MAKFGTVEVECPVCHKPWIVRISGRMLPRAGKPGQAKVTVTVAKPLRVPREHRTCIAKVD